MKNLSTILSLVIIFGLILNCPFSISSQNFFEENLILHLPFSGDADDMSESENHGIVHGAILTEDRFGNAESAYYFDCDARDYIELSHMLPNMTHSTFAVWVYYTSENKRGAIFCDATMATANDYLINMNQNSIGIRADKGGAGLLLEYGALVDLDLGFAWHHIAWVMTPDSSMIYLDGEWKITIDTTGSNVDFHNLHASIGRRHVGEFGDYHYKGKIDELCIYSRALDDNEIQMLYMSSGVDDINYDLNDIYIMPNPGSNVVEIINLPDENNWIEIYDLTGSCLMKQKSTSHIDISALPKGLYVIKVYPITNNYFRTLKLTKK